MVVSITLSSAIIFCLFFSATTSDGFCLLSASSLKGARSSEKGYRNFFYQYLGSRFISKCLGCFGTSSLSPDSSYLSLELGKLLSILATILARLRFKSSNFSLAALIWSLKSAPLPVFSSLNSQSFLSSSSSRCFSLFA